MTLMSQPATTTPQLDGLVTATRAALNHRADWQRTAQLVASALRRHLPSPEVVPGDQERPHSQLLHVEPDGAFSIQAVVWPPGRVTRIHDHVSWCVFGVIQGVVDEELFTLDGSGEFLVPGGHSTNATGAVNGFAPPGDIHRVANTSGHTAISINVYGTDLSRIGSSPLRYYDLPVAPEID